MQKNTPVDVSRQRQTLLPQLTFEQICDLEPRVRELYELVVGIGQAARSADAFCAINHWHGSPRQNDGRSIRRKLKSLVGPDAKDPRLATWASHDTAHRTLWGALPGCRGCVCCGRGDSSVPDPPLLFDLPVQRKVKAARAGDAQ
jgi:hypothetical protein